MLRRAPTAIALTPEDIAAYDDARSARLARSTHHPTPDAAHLRTQNAKGGVLDPSDELKPLPGEKARGVRGAEGRREERIMGR
ncbi:hypothetical protein MMC13_006231 [Lambiella insularis]|nr:hypothetical protein [Lambiella insularis]